MERGASNLEAWTALPTRFCYWWELPLMKPFAICKIV